MTAPSTTRPTGGGSERAVGVWLLGLCALVFAMVVLGGVTRLTHSGLSMTEWRPATGWLPPLGEAAWAEQFAAYKRFPEYRELNPDMSLGEFKSIFRIEYAHRLLGRLIGLAFLVPFLYLLARRRVPRRLTGRLAAIFALGALQGLLGWYMVQSGLVERPDVSQYRLVAHLGLAVVIYGVMLWTALDLLMAPAGAGAGLRPWALALVGLIFVAVLSGGLVAGLDAGFLYNTFPLMEGRWVAAEAFTTRPLIRDLFENPASAQFAHRLLALAVALAVAAFWLRSRRLPLAAGPRFSFHALMAALVLQEALGILTLVHVVPVALSAAHQAGALILLSAALASAHALGRGRARQ